jgi:hypothetical protein
MATPRCCAKELLRKHAKALRKAFRGIETPISRSHVGGVYSKQREAQAAPPALTFAKDV